MSAAVMSSSLDLTSYDFGELMKDTSQETLARYSISSFAETLAGLSFKYHSSLRQHNSHPVVSTAVQRKNGGVDKLSWDANDQDFNRPLPISLMSLLLVDNLTQQTHKRLERTQSEPAKTPSSGGTLNANTSRYKTELCRPYEESGTCKYGDKCQFAHGGQELRCLVRHPKYKTELCRTFHTVGFCPYGPRCHFIHNADEARGGKSRPRPLSLDTSPSPPSSLGSVSPPPGYGFGSPATPPLSPPPPPASPESRLPVFNRISAPQPPLLTLPLRYGSELIA